MIPLSTRVRPKRDNPPLFWRCWQGVVEDSQAAGEGIVYGVRFSHGTFLYMHEYQLEVIEDE